MDNLVQQKDELEALSSIYGSDWKEESDSSCYFSIEIDDNVKVYITLNSEYPSNSPPSYQLQAPSLDRSTKQQISNGFEEIYLILEGPSFFNGLNVYGNLNPPDNKVELQTEFAEKMSNKNYNIVTGPPIQDRKSTFQGHFCEVKSQEDVRCVMNILLENKKIAQATHNISAYRIKTDTGSILQDCDDDGENHAGGRLLHLLQILNVTNVFVVVSRWYGGVQLGPDRFRHINNAARQVLGEAGVIKL
ncbi:impact-related [Holotrichia oblita]|uniref:Impact-related n=1 Tax=Holotrichia oblita TaxID=644536 RepID=A0ACB9TTS2_HOLOL|nr:impact-related [Holotrichia oblita]